MHNLNPWASLLLTANLPTVSFTLSFITLLHLFWCSAVFPLYNSFLRLNFHQGLCFALWKCLWLLFIMWFHDSESFKFVCVCVCVCVWALSVCVWWLFNSEGLNRHKSYVCTRGRFCQCLCVCVSVCLHISSTWEVVTLHQWQRGRVCAETVDGASERPNYSCVICFSSRLRNQRQSHPTISTFWRKYIHKIGLKWLGFINSNIKCNNTS